MKKKFENAIRKFTRKFSEIDVTDECFTRPHLPSTPLAIFELKIGLFSELYKEICSSSFRNEIILSHRNRVVEKTAKGIKRIGYRFISNRKLLSVLSGDIKRRRTAVNFLMYSMSKSLHDAKDEVEEHR